MGSMPSSHPWPPHFVPEANGTFICIRAKTFHTVNQILPTRGMKFSARTERTSATSAVHQSTPTLSTTFSESWHSTG